VSQHALSINGKRNDITKDDLLIIAKSISIKKANSIINDINEKVALWNNYAEAVNVQSKLRNAINKTLIRLN